MEWEDKIQMVKLGNQENVSKEAKDEFQKFIKENIESFDTQAWDMFSTLCTITVEDIKSDIEYWKIIYPIIKKADINDPGISFRASLRLGIIQTICEELGL